MKKTGPRGGRWRCSSWISQLLHLLAPQCWAGSSVPSLTMVLILVVKQQKEVCKWRGGSSLGTGTQSTSSYPFPLCHGFPLFSLSDLVSPGG